MYGMLYKGSEIVGKPIYPYDTGEKLNSTVKDLVLERGGNRVLGFLVEGAEGEEIVLPLSAVRAIEPRAIIVFNRAALLEAKLLGDTEQGIAFSTMLKGDRLTTTEGYELGAIADLCFDARTGEVKGYELSEEILADNPTATARGSKFQLSSPRVSQALPSERAANPAAQKAFVTGKVAQYEVVTPNGTALVVSGQVITSAHAAVAQNLGILDRLYRAAGGQEQQKLQEQALYSTAEWGQGKARVESELRVGDVSLGPTGLKTLDNSTVETSRDPASERELDQKSLNDEGSALWERIQQTVSLAYNNSAQIWEDRQVQNALGRPITRILRDAEGEMILDLGDLITYEAIRRAKEAGVLNYLLSAVYEPDS